MSQVMKLPAFAAAAAGEAHADAAAARLDWVDAAKGIGIVLVVIGHAIGGLVDAGIQPSPDWFRPVMLAIYFFHMPLFFFLSGLFFPDRLQAGPAGVARRSLTGIVWPYLLWGGLQVMAIHAAGRYVNAPIVDLGETLRGMAFSSPPSQFWFLYVLLVAQLLAMVLLPLAGAGGLLGVAVLAWLLAPGPLPVVAALALKMLPFFALGCLVGGRKWLAALPAPTGRGTAAVVAVAALTGLATAAGLIAMAGEARFAALRAGGIADLAWQPMAAGAALAGIAAVIAVARRCRGRSLGVLACLGRRSMAIYVLHILALASTRILLVKGLGVEEPAIMPLLVAVGVGVPLLAAEVARRLGVARLLAL